MLVEFSKAVSLLLALCLVQGFILDRWRHGETVGRVVSGLLFGGICIVGMETPVVLSPGVIFDARSVVLSLAGLFGGPIVGGIAGVIAASYRAWLGGGGAVVGVAVVASCVLLGLVYRWAWKRGRAGIGVGSLLLFGLVVHLAVLGHFLFLPDEAVRAIMSGIAAPLLLTFVPATALLGHILHTIEERLSTHLSLAASEARFRDFAEISADWIWEMGPDLRFTYFSPAFSRGTGWDPDCLNGGEGDDAVARDVAADARRALTAVLERGASFHGVELTIRDRSGGEKTVSMSGKPVLDATGAFSGYRGVASDITDRLTAEVRLQESEKSLIASQLLAGMGDFVWTVETGEVKWSDGLYHLLGYAPDEPVDFSKVQKAVHHPEDLERVTRLLEEGLASGCETLPRSQYRLVRKDGSVLHAQIDGRFERTADGRAVRLFGTCLDVTESVELQRRLKGSQRMEAIGQLTGGIAHDFNNLLAAMTGSTELLEDRVGDDPEARPHLDALFRALERSASLTSRLLAFSRRQTLEPVTTDVSSLVLGLQDILQRTLGEDVDLVVVVSPDLAPARIDPHQFEDALVNLAINARDAMPEGGTLTIEAANVHLDEAYATRYDEVSAGDYVRTSVTDSGMGMTEEVRQQVFEPFFTTKDVGQGSGLGLSMVYGFAKQSGGHVTVYSEIGQGTTVNLYLPRSAEAAVPRDAVERVAPARGGSERILVVEDDESVRRVPATLLRAQGYAVEEANNGVEAIALAEAGRFDLLFTDVVLPGGMRGGQIAEEIRRMQPGIKVMFTTGYAENALSRIGSLDPGGPLISKPYRRAELLEQVRMVLDGDES